MEQVGCTCNYVIRGWTVLLVKISRVQSMNSPKLKGSQIKRPNNDGMNGIARLHMQLRYLWLNSSVKKNQESTVFRSDEHKTSKQKSNKLNRFERSSETIGLILKNL